MRRKNLILSSKGMVATEFALVAPILFLLLFGIVDLATYMYASNVIENATASAARLGLTGSDYTGDTDADQNTGNLSREDYVVSKVRELSEGLIDYTKLRIEETQFDSFGGASLAAAREICKSPNDEEADCTFGSSGETEMLVVEYPWNVSPLLAPIFSETILIRAVAVVQNE